MLDWRTNLPETEEEFIAFINSLPFNEQELMLDHMKKSEARRLVTKLFSYYPEVGPLRRELYPRHMEFFNAGANYRERCFMAANRIGKTEGAGGYETTLHLTGRYPAWWTGKRFAKPVQFWAAGKTNETTRDIVQKKLFGKISYKSGRKGFDGTGLIPLEDIGAITWKQGVSDLADTVQIKHQTGGWSQIGLKSYQQGRGSFEGTEQDGIWLDEEPPIDIYGECLIRTATTKGIIYTTFTPLEGMSEMAMSFLPDGNKPRSVVSASRYLVMAGWDDVPHLDEQTKRELLDSTPIHLRDARSKGIPVLGSGRIFPVDEALVMIEPFQLPDIWPRIAAMDIGWDHPTAMVWGAIDRDENIIYFYDSIRESEKTPGEFAPRILEKGTWIPMAWPHDALQHEKGTGVQMAEQYRGMGVNMLHEMAQFPETGDGGETRVSRTSVEAGLFMMLQAFKANDPEYYATLIERNPHAKPLRIKVFSTMHDWFQEFRIYHRKEGKVVKLMDDLMSATRYAVMMERYAVVPADPEKSSLNVKREYDWRIG